MASSFERRRLPFLLDHPAENSGPAFKRKLLNFIVEYSGNPQGSNIRPLKKIVKTFSYLTYGESQSKGYVQDKKDLVNGKNN